MRFLLAAALALLPVSAWADNKAFGFDTTPAKATDPAGNLNFTQPINYPANQFATEGVVRNFGNAANKIPVIDGTGKLVIGIIPNLPASIITSGTFADNRIASAATWNGKENALTFSPPLSRSGNTISIPAATASVDGYLTAANFVTFNSKQNAITTGSTAQYFRGDLSLATLNKAAVAGIHDNDDVVFGYVQSVGTNAAFLFGERDATGADWIGYANSGVFHLYNGSDRLTLGATGNLSVTGTVSGSNLSGTNTGDQTITLTGDATGSGAGSFAVTFATVNSNTGTFGDSTHVPQFTVNGKGLITAASNIALTSASVGLGSVTNDAQTKAAIVPNTAPTAGQILIGNAGGTAYAPATVSGSGATITLGSTGTIAISGIANASLTNSAITIGGTSTALGGSITTDTILGGLSTTGFVKRTGANTYSIDGNTYLTGNQSITLSGDVSGTGTTAITTTIGAGKVTLAMNANMATASFLGRNTAGSGPPEVLAASTAKTMLNLTGTNSGDVTLAGQNYITISGQVITAGAVDLSGTHATGTIAAARMPAHTGDVTSSAGSLTLTLPNIATAGTNTKITYNAKGQVTGGTTLAAGDVPSTLNATNFSGNVAITGALSTTGTFSPADYDIGVAASYSPNVVLDGDSLHQQLGGINSYFGTGSVPALGTFNGFAVSPATGQNVAVAGRTVAQWRANLGTLQGTFRREAGMNIAVIEIGTNSLVTKTPKEVFSEIAAGCAHLRQTGWRVVLVGLLSRGNGSNTGSCTGSGVTPTAPGAPNSGSSWDDLVGAVNGLIRQNWTQFADRFIDWGVIGGPFAAGGYSNLTYYTCDQLHQQVAGAQSLATYEANTINDLLTFYFQSQRNQLFVHMNKTTHGGTYGNGMFTLNNENPSAGQNEINFAFNKTVKENIRGDYNGAITVGATGYIALTVHPSGPDGTDIYAATGNTDTGERFYAFTDRIESMRTLRVTSNSGAGFTSGKGVEINYSSSLDYGFLTVYDRTTPAWKPLLIQASSVKWATGGTDRAILQAGLNIGGNSDPGAAKVSIGPAPTAGSPSTARLTLLTDSGAATYRLLSMRNGAGANYGWDWMVDDATTGDLSLQRVVAGTSTQVLNISRASGGVNIGSGNSDPGAGNLVLYASNDTSIRLNTASGTAAARNWSVATNYAAWGDFQIKQSTTLGGDPNTGTTRLYIGATGGVNFSGTGDPGAGNLVLQGQNGQGGILYFGNGTGGSRYLQYNTGVGAYDFGNAAVYANGTLLTSSREAKQDIKDWKLDSATKRRRLRPRSFEYKTDPATPRVGFVAEEVAEVLPDAVKWGPSDPTDPKKSRLLAIDPLVIAAKHESEIQAALDRIEELEMAIAKLSGKPEPPPMPDASPALIPTPPPTPTATVKPTPTPKKGAI